MFYFGYNYIALNSFHILRVYTVLPKCLLMNDVNLW